MSEQQAGNRSEALEPFEDFVRRHVGPSDEEQEGMLKVLGYESLDALVDAAVPGSVRSLGTLDLPPAVSEQQVLDELRRLAARNTIAEPMIGLGYSGTITPGVIRRNVLESPAWYTAYTPVPARDQPGPAGGPPELPDDGDRSHRARHGERLAARREHRGGRGRHAHAPPCHRASRTGSSSTPTACPRPSPCWRRASAPLGLVMDVVDLGAGAARRATTSAWCSSIRVARARSVTSRP